jgi:hypothetical protein
MSVSYTCPNPDCGVTLKTPARVQVGKSVKCPKCAQPFVPESGAKGAAPKPAAKPEPPKPEPAPATSKDSRFDPEDEDAESVRKGYGVISETEAEKEEAEKNKPTFTEVQEKFKKSARGPAMSLLVMPSNLLLIAGLITGVGGLGSFVYGMWPLVFNDGPPGDEELEEAIVTMMLGVCVLFWGAMVCFGASQMQELSSYPWAMTGSVMGVVPLLVGIYGILMLQNPKVKAGFEEGEGGPNSEDGDDDPDDDDDDDDDPDDDDDDDDDDEKAKTAKKKGVKKDGGKKDGDKKAGGKKGGTEKKPGKKLARKSAGDEDDDE